MYHHMTPQERMERIAQLLLRAIAIEERDSRRDLDGTAPATRVPRQNSDRVVQAKSDVTSRES